MADFKPGPMHNGTSTRVALTAADRAKYRFNGYRDGMHAEGEKDSVDAVLKVARASARDAKQAEAAIEESREALAAGPPSGADRPESDDVAQGQVPEGTPATTTSSKATPARSGSAKK